jgi:hypothetical protein
MRNILLLPAFLLTYSTGFAQHPRFVIDIEVGYLQFKNDSVKFKTPKVFSINTSGCTEIFSLGKSRQYEFGMRIEILASRLTGDEKYLVGKAYYIRKDDQWQEVMKIEHSEIELRPVARRERTFGSTMGGASTDYPDLFDVRLNDSYYRAQ